MRSNTSLWTLRRGEPHSESNRQGNTLGLILILLLITVACGRSFHPTPNPTTETTHTITFDGMERSYILHVSASYTGDNAVPLVLDFHGGGGNANSEMSHSGFGELADAEGFIVASPNGTGRLEDKVLTWNGGTCCGYAVTNNIDDVGFVRALIAEIEASYKIDSKRVYATGMSNGGIMSYRLACEASDLIAAIGPVSGTQKLPSCQPTENVSVIHFHGTDDGHLPYNGGIGPDSLAGVPFVSVKDTIGFWLNFNQCPSTPQTISFDDVQLDTYTNCIHGTEVQLYTIVGGKHAWPGSDGPGWAGGDQPTQSISATSLIWEFFAAHPKQE